MNSAFDLTFPTVDDITSELKHLGRGTLIYKVDVSRAFRHVKVDPRDYDLLGLHWGAYYVDSCVPFGTRHGSQISNASATLSDLLCVEKVTQSSIISTTTSASAFQALRLRHMPPYCS